MGIKFFIIFIASITFFGSIWLMFFNKKSTTSTIPKEGNIIFFGDSLVEGVGASSGNDLSSQLSRRIGLPIINAGRSGETTASALTRLENDVLFKSPRLVIVLLGGNDALRQVPAQDVAQNLAIMIDKIQKTGAGVLLLGIRSGIFGDPYKEMFEELVTEKKVFYIPNILDDVIGRTDLMSDPIHPNDEGYARLVNRIEPVLRKILRGQ